MEFLNNDCSLDKSSKNLRGETMEVKVALLIAPWKSYKRAMENFWNLTGKYCKCRNTV